MSWMSPYPSLEWYKDINVNHLSHGFESSPPL
jgi:hypothetical protein